MTIIDAKGIKLGKLTNNISEIVHRGSTFVGLIMTIVNFSIAIEEEYNKKFVATRSVYILKNLIGSDFLTGLRVWSYY